MFSSRQDESLGLSTICCDDELASAWLPDMLTTTGVSCSISDSSSSLFKLELDDFRASPQPLPSSTASSATMPSSSTTAFSRPASSANQFQPTSVVPTFILERQSRYPIVEAQSPIDFVTEPPSHPSKKAKRYPVSLPESDEAKLLSEQSLLKGVRGEKRKKLLANLAPQDIKREESLRIERSRQSARECRQRKKAYILSLEQRCHEFEQRLKEAEQTTRQLHSKTTALQEEKKQLLALLQFQLMK